MEGLVVRRVVKVRVRTAAALVMAALTMGLASGCGGSGNTYVAAGGSGGVASGTSGDGNGGGGKIAGTAGVSGGNSTEGGFGGSGAGQSGSGGVPPIGGVGGSIAGTFGRAGTFNFGGFPQAGGGSGGAPPVPTTRLGQGCVNDTECDPAATSGLTCLREDSTALDGGGPPGGMCSIQCANHDTCWSISENSLCVSFGATSYCVESCLQGPPGSLLDPPKCHYRSDFACTPLDAFPIQMTCINYLDCPAGHACFGGECVLVMSGCLPACAGDVDCPAGTFCDGEVGTCNPGSSAGLPLGSECDPAATDPCRGFCQAVSDLPGLDGMCAEICSFLNPCAWDDGADYAGACLLTTAINETPDIGDYGFCSQLCDCSSDCITPTFGCIPIPGLQEHYGRPGLCLYPFEADGTPSETLECP